ncbi:hypothetical protein TIFTF001_050152 [Ficus carica]|uniref:Uncharacterized protein n=1 Tax=Ficus carica TaxID=3494 RepID=A0AA88CIC1_FICCA|nr:hypothetical protein TIFTF001_050152 [Ficus carica]
MRTVLVISVAIVLVVACFQAADAKTKYTIPEGPPEGRKLSGAAAIITGGRPLLEANTVVSSPNTDETVDREAGCGEPRGKLDPSLQTYGKVKEWPVVVETKGEEKFWIKPTKSLSGIKGAKVSIMIMVHDLISMLA